MLVDCDTCTVRGAACGDCLVSALLDTPREILDLTAPERAAIEVLARAGFDVEVLAVAGAPAVPRPRRRRRHVA
ncbi:hypothetical protein [Rhizomonospora bruguierae]|uniref:hypothetical protein n=1 Tax=Rhizomonospora bruguierae TaxID=1581705 RepID=UPI001BD0736B|nr:hypothetical protein [Micromonospora sp. NBRC 107566]